MATQKYTGEFVINLYKEVEQNIKDASGNHINRILFVRGCPILNLKLPKSVISSSLGK